MHRNNQQNRSADRLLKMPGKLDRGPVNFESRIARQEGEIMAIASHDVVSVAPTTSIIGAVKTMTECGFRRLPITDPGTRKLRGIVTAGDIIDLMGGGNKYNLVQVKHNGNLLAAINESVREIMTTDVMTVPDSARIHDAVDIIVHHKIGGLPIINSGGILSGIVTEKDVMKVLSTEKSLLAVKEIMSTALKVTNPDSPIGMATREMIRHRFRRLPVVKDDVLFGIVTNSDIVRYLGSGKVFNKLVTGDIGEVMGLPVRTLISGALHTTTPDQNINDAARNMLEKGIGALPVIEDTRLVGLVTEFDLVKAFARE
ncbi:MAG: CBS domain-containing protein [Methanomicrobiales archaeon]|nr:CBS domain-containing protein [Methanomicrobiales archaeon]